MDGNRRFNRRLVTLPAALRRSGYETAAFSQNPLFTPAHGFAEGFDEFFEADVLAGARRRMAQRTARSRFRAARKTGLYFERLLAPRDAFSGIARWMTDRRGNAPFFAFANLLAPHSPWVVPPSSLVRARALDPRYLWRRDYISLERGEQVDA